MYADADAKVDGSRNYFSLLGCAMCTLEIHARHGDRRVRTDWPENGPATHRAPGLRSDSHHENFR